MKVALLRSKPGDDPLAQLSLTVSSTQFSAKHEICAFWVDFSHQCQKVRIVVLSAMLSVSSSIRVCRGTNAHPLFHPCQKRLPWGLPLGGGLLKVGEADWIPPIDPVVDCDDKAFVS